MRASVDTAHCPKKELPPLDWSGKPGLLGEWHQGPPPAQRVQDGVPVFTRLESDTMQAYWEYQGGLPTSLQQKIHADSVDAIGSLPSDFPMQEFWVYTWGAPATYTTPATHCVKGGTTFVHFLATDEEVEAVGSVADVLGTSRHEPKIAVHVDSQETIALLMEMGPVYRIRLVPGLVLSDQPPYPVAATPPLP